MAIQMLKKCSFVSPRVCSEFDFFFLFVPVTIRFVHVDVKSGVEGPEKSHVAFPLSFCVSLVFLCDKLFCLCVSPK